MNGISDDSKAVTSLSPAATNLMIKTDKQPSVQEVLASKPLKWLSPLAEIDKVNQNVFISKCAPLLSDLHDFKKGICNGLTLLWAYNKLQGRESLFFDQYKAFLSWDGKSAINYEMKDFVQRVKFLQDPSSHLLTQANFNEAVRCFKRPDECFIRSDYQLSFNYSREDLSSLLARLELENKVILIRSPYHTVAAVKRKGRYHFYDPNIGDELYRLSEQNFVDCLFEHLARLLSNPSAEYLPINIEIFSDAAKSPDPYPCKEECISRFLQKDPNFTRDSMEPGYTAIICAARNGDSQTAKLLLSYGASPQNSYKGYNCIEFAAAYNQIETVKLFHQAGESIDKALIQVAKFEWLDSLRTLLSMGANVHCRDVNGHSALDMASAFGNLESMVILLKAGAWSEQAFQLAPAHDQTAKANVLRILHQYAQYRTAATLSVAQQAPVSASPGLAPKP